MGRIPGEESATVTKLALSYIRPYHREIARRLVLGQKASTIARELGMSEPRLSIIVNSPLFKMEVRKLEQERDAGVADITKTLKEISPMALEVMERIMYTSRSDKIRLDAAESILDRAGYGAINKTAVRIDANINQSIGSMSDHELKQLVKDRVDRMRESLREKARKEAEAASIEVEFDHVPEEPQGDCSVPEPSPSPIKVMSV